jgi:hypothetical protein
MTDLNTAIREFDSQLRGVIDSILGELPDDVDIPLAKEYMVKHSTDTEGVVEDVWYCMSMDNFQFKLPYSYRREQSQQYRDELFLVDGGTKTVGQLWDDIDMLIKECGIDLSKIESLQRRMADLNSQKQSDISERRQLLEVVFPVYVGLRFMGYTLEEV